MDTEPTRDVSSTDEPDPSASRPDGGSDSLIVRIRGWSPPVITFVVLLGIWEALSSTGVFNPIVLPAPSRIFTTFLGILNEGFFWDAVWVTVAETLMGWGIGLVAGLLLGTFIGLIRAVRRAVYPIAIMLQTTPTVAIAPLFLVWFGFGMTPRVAFAAVISFFPVLLGVVVGLQNVSVDSQVLMRSLGASKWAMYWKLLFPASLPVVFGNVRYSATLALTGAIIGEFVGGNTGVGVRIARANFQLDISRTFALVFVLALFGLLLFGTVALIDRKIVFWRRADH